MFGELTFTRIFGIINKIDREPTLNQFRAAVATRQRNRNTLCPLYHSRRDITWSSAQARRSFQIEYDRRGLDYIHAHLDEHSIAISISSIRRARASQDLRNLK
jgi:hypothetical protein